MITEANGKIFRITVNLIQFLNPIMQRCGTFKRLNLIGIVMSRGWIFGYCHLDRMVVEAIIQLERELVLSP